MAIRLIKGRLQQWSNVCKNNFTKKDSMRYTKLQKDVCHNLWRAQTALIRLYNNHNFFSDYFLFNLVLTFFFLLSCREESP